MTGDSKGSPGALMPFRAMYLGYYMAIGAYMPFINLYYERMGLSGVQIGTLAALLVLVSSVATLLWSSLADVLHWHRRILRIALLLAPVAIFLISRASDYISLFPFVSAYAFFSSPILPIVDGSALEVAETHNSSYGSLRAWGTLGWSISTWLVGAVVERTTIYALFYGYIAFIVLTFFLSLFMPPRKKVLRAPLKHGLQQLLLRADFLLFLLSVFLLTLTLGAMMSFFSIYLDGIGAGEGMIGLAWTVAALSEIPVMLYSGRLIRRIGARGLLVIGFATYTLRWLLLSFITNPLGAILLQLLHGLSFAAFLVGGVTYVNERTPDGLSTTAQAVFSTVCYGLASIVGSLVGGYIYDKLGMLALFRILSLIAAASLAIFWITRDVRVTETVPDKPGI